MIGGGVNGCAIARDLAGRGLSVMLVEKDDLASATSSASTKLIHGGLRYLEHYEFRLVREALQEREVLLKAAPHIIWPLTFILPHHKKLRPWWMIRLGLFLYDYLGGCKILEKSHGKFLTGTLAGAPLKQEFRRGFSYSDCWVEDTRLVVLNAVDAHEKGAQILTRTECTAIARNAKQSGWTATLFNHRTDEKFKLHAQMIVNASRFMTSYWWFVLLWVIGISVGLIFAYKRSPRFAHFLARMVLKLPVVGQILHQSAIARFSRTLGVTFAAGVPLVEALDSVSGATGSPIYNDAVKRIRDDVSVGHQLQLAMRQANLFPNMVVQMVAIGEESGALDKMLFKVAEFYEQEVNNAVDALSSLLEPFIMVIIGTIVGGLVVGMYLPIFKLAAVVG